MRLKEIQCRSKISTKFKEGILNIRSDYEYRHYSLFLLPVLFIVFPALQYSEDNAFHAGIIHASRLIRFVFVLRSLISREHAISAALSGYLIPNAYARRGNVVLRDPLITRRSSCDIGVRGGTRIKFSMKFTRRRTAA